MNTMHQANRRYWDRATDWWKQLEAEACQVLSSPERMESGRIGLHQ